MVEIPEGNPDSLAKNILTYKSLMIQRKKAEGQAKIWNDKEDQNKAIKHMKRYFTDEVCNIDRRLKSLPKGLAKFIKHIEKQQAKVDKLKTGDEIEVKECLDFSSFAGKSCPFCGKQFQTAMDRMGILDPDGAPLFVSRPGNASKGIYIHPTCYMKSLQTYLASYAYYNTMFDQLMKTYNKINGLKDEN